MSEAKLRVHFLLSLALKFEHRDFNQHNTLYYLYIKQN
jgi:hypothetical protein